MKSKRKILIGALIVSLCLALASFFLGRTPEPEAAKMRGLDDRESQEAAAFVQMAFGVFIKDGEAAFRSFWRKVDETIFSESVATLSNAREPSKALAVLSPKVVERQIFVFMRYEGLPYDVQYVLVKEPEGLKIEGIYPTRELR